MGQIPPLAAICCEADLRQGHADLVVCELDGLYVVTIGSLDPCHSPCATCILGSEYHRLETVQRIWNCGSLRRFNKDRTANPSGGKRRQQPGGPRPLQSECPSTDSRP